MHIYKVSCTKEIVRSSSSYIHILSTDQIAAAAAATAASQEKKNKNKNKPKKTDTKEY